MVRSRYPYLVQQRRRWFVRMVVPADVRDIIGQAIFKVPTGRTDEHRAATVAPQLVAELQERIRTAREAGRRLEQVTAEQLAERYRAERESDPERAEITKVTDIINFVLTTHGHKWVDHARQVREAGYDVHAALRLLPGGAAAAQAADRITGHATPLLTYLERWNLCIPIPIHLYAYATYLCIKRKMHRDTLLRLAPSLRLSFPSFCSAVHRRKPPWSPSYEIAWKSRPGCCGEGCAVALHPSRDRHSLAAHFVRVAPLVPYVFDWFCCRQEGMLKHQPSSKPNTV
jgi:hypothetical protein